MPSLLVLALAAYAAASPIVKPRVVQLRGRSASSQLEAYKRDNDQFVTWWSQIESNRLKGKYRLKNASNKKRAESEIQISDEYSQGLDQSYYGGASFGTPAQSLDLLFDTGSSDVWVNIGNSNCQTTAFDTSSSSTYQGTSTSFTIQYGSGNVAGNLAYDVVTVAGLTVNQQAFGAVDQCSSSFVGQPYSGLLGLAFSSIASDQKTTFVENLIQEGQLDSPEFSFYLERGGASGSTLTIGGVDTSHASGSVQYTPVTSQTYWEVQAEQPIVNGQSVGSAFSAAIDTGTTLVYVPTAVASAIWGAVSGASIDQTNTGDGSGGTFYKFPCNSEPTIALTFAGISGSFPINAQDLNLGATDVSGYCTGGIVGQDFTGVNGEDLAIVGDVFLKSVVSVFSYDANNGSPAVGFAEAN